MRFSICCVAIASALSLASVGSAQEAATVKAGALLKSSDGKRVGRIERVVSSKEGTPVAASVIVDSRFVYVPLTTITPAEDGFVTSLSRADVRKLK